MLDLGGAPSGLHDRKNAVRRIDASKNCQVQAVCFDFDVLIRSVDDAKDKTFAGNGGAAVSTTTTTQGSDLGKVQPNANVVQQVAELLNVNLGGTSSSSNTFFSRGRRNKYNDEDDDLSLLTGENKSTTTTPHAAAQNKKNQSEPPPPAAAVGDDVRAKYAAKLAQKGVQGGVAGVELAKHQIQETLQKGDAAGHLAARKMAAAEPTGGSSSNNSAKTRWMAVSGTGNLLQYLTQRSMKICLLPKPSTELNEEEGQQMEDFKKQLNEVVFELLFKDGSLGVGGIIKNTLESLHCDPTRVLLVSDRDDYTREAKAENMVVCRIQPPNGRRGNVSPHYTVPSVPDVKDVVDEINGISFNALSKGR